MPARNTERFQAALYQKRRFLVQPFPRGPCDHCAEMFVRGRRSLGLDRGVGPASEVPHEQRN